MNEKWFYIGEYQEYKIQPYTINSLPTSIYEYQEPFFSIILFSSANSMTSAILEIPFAKIISVVADLKGAANLFLTTFNLITFPIISSFVPIEETFLTSILIEE